MLKLFIFAGYVELETLRKLDAEAVEIKEDQWISAEETKEISSHMSPPELRMSR